MVRPEVTESEPARAGEVAATRCTDLVGETGTPATSRAAGARIERRVSPRGAESSGGRSKFTGG